MFADDFNDKYFYLNDNMHSEISICIDWYFFTDHCDVWMHGHFKRVICTQESHDVSVMHYKTAMRSTTSSGFPIAVHGIDRCTLYVHTTARIPSILCPEKNRPVRLQYTTDKHSWVPHYIYTVNFLCMLFQWDILSTCWEHVCMTWWDSVTITGWDGN